MAKERRRYIKRTVFAIHTDFDTGGHDFSVYDREADAYRVAAGIANDNYSDSRDFRDEDKAEHRKLWAAKDYRGVVELWGEVMSEATDHQDFIRVTRTTFRVRLSPRRGWQRRAGKQDPDAVFIDGVPTLRKSSVFAEESLRLYARRIGVLYETGIEPLATDLITDLRHLCDREGVDFHKLLETAGRNYAHTTEGKL